MGVVVSIFKSKISEIDRDLKSGYHLPRESTSPAAAVAGVLDMNEQNRLLKYAFSEELENGVN